MSRIAHCTIQPNRVIAVLIYGEEAIPASELPANEFYSHEEKWQLIPEEGFVEPEAGFQVFLLEDSNPAGVAGFMPLPPPSEGLRTDAPE